MQLGKSSETLESAMYLSRRKPCIQLFFLRLVEVYKTVSLPNLVANGRYLIELQFFRSRHCSERANTGVMIVPGRSPHTRNVAVLTHELKRTEREICCHAVPACFDIATVQLYSLISSHVLRQFPGYKAD